MTREFNNAKNGKSANGAISQACFINLTSVLTLFNGLRLFPSRYCTKLYAEFRNKLHERVKVY